MSSKISEKKRSVRHFYRIPGFSPAFVDATKRKLEQVRTTSLFRRRYRDSLQHITHTDYANEEHAFDDGVLFQCRDSRYAESRARETIELVVDRDVRTGKFRNRDVFEKFR